MRTVIEIYMDSRKEWRWRMKAHNGKIIADSGEGYKRKGNAEIAALKLVERMAKGDAKIVTA